MVTLESVYKILKPGGMIIICEPGTGHSKSVSSLEAKKIYGVTERDMPPKLSKNALKNAGFKNIKTYAHPARLHRVNYKQFLNNKKILNRTVSRGVLSLAFSSFLKNKHGIVTATK